MSTQFSISTCIFKALFLLGILLSGIATTSVAGNRVELMPIPVQTIVPSETFVYKVEVSKGDAPAPTLRMVNAPTGAIFDDNGDGSRTFRWRPPTGVSAETVVIIQAIDARGAGVVDTKRLVLRRGQQLVSGVSSANAKSNTNSPLLSSPPALPAIAKQFLIVNQDYQLYIRPTVVDGAFAVLTSGSLPDGASLDDSFDGSRVLRWRPSADQLGEHTIVFRVAYADALSLVAERSIRFKVNTQSELLSNEGGAQLELSEQQQLDALTASQGDNSEQEAQAQADQPNFDPIPSQVVSAGKRVKFLVRPRMPDQSSAILHVDRLPPTASFADNNDGTRTFDWLTTESDQGEHVFRFTAIHHRNVNQRVTTEVLIVVGDPAAPGSKPDEVTGDVGALNLNPLEQTAQGS